MSTTTIKLRAGIAEYNEETRTCTPVPVQGEIRMNVNAEEEELGFWDFEWVPLEKPVGDNAKFQPLMLILIPGETLWVPIKSCNSGRMFALVFSSNEKYFFWLQEKNPKNLGLNELNEKDKKVFDKMMKLLNSPEQNASDSDTEVTQEKKEENDDIAMEDAN